MKFKVILYSTLRDKLPPENNGRIELELPDSYTISDVIKLLDLSGVFICTANGQIERNTKRLIREKDELRFFRPGSGGCST